MISKFLFSVSYALQGLKFCINSEKNFRIQLFVAVITILFGLMLGLTNAEWIAILICCALVLSAEMFNTSIERLSDVVISKIHPVIKQVKDIAAGAVFITSMISLIIGCIIFIPRIIFIIKRI